MKEEKVNEVIGAANQAAQQPQGLKITPDMIRASKNVSCECGGMLFTEKIFFKRIHSNTYQFFTKRNGFGHC
jgi:hypothetical protein